MSDPVVRYLAMFAAALAGVVVLWGVYTLGRIVERKAQAREAKSIVGRARTILKNAAVLAAAVNAQAERLGVIAKRAPDKP